MFLSRNITISLATSEEEGFRRSSTTASAGGFYAPDPGCFNGGNTRHQPIFVAIGRAGSHA